MLADVDAQIREVESHIEQGKDEVSRLIDLEVRAKQWADLQERQRKLDERWRLAQTTLADTTTIQRDLDSIARADGGAAAPEKRLRKQGGTAQHCIASRETRRG